MHTVFFWNVSTLYLQIPSTGKWNNKRIKNYQYTEQQKNCLDTERNSKIQSREKLFKIRGISELLSKCQLYQHWRFKLKTQGKGGGGGGGGGVCGTIPWNIQFSRKKKNFSNFQSSRKKKKINHKNIPFNLTEREYRKENSVVCYDTVFYHNIFLISSRLKGYTEHTTSWITLNSYYYWYIPI